MKPKYQPCPPLDPELIRWLNEVFPERSPKRGDRIEDIMFAAGGREVVRILNIELEKQQKGPT